MDDLDAFLRQRFVTSRASTVQALVFPPSASSSIWAPFLPLLMRNALVICGSASSEDEMSVADLANAIRLEKTAVPDGH